MKWLAIAVLSLALLGMGLRVGGLIRMVEAQQAQIDSLKATQQRDRDLMLRLTDPQTIQDRTIKMLLGEDYGCGN